MNLLGLLIYRRPPPTTTPIPTLRLSLRSIGQLMAKTVLTRGMPLRLYFRTRKPTNMQRPCWTSRIKWDLNGDARAPTTTSTCRSTCTRPRGDCPWALTNSLMATLTWPRPPSTTRSLLTSSWSRPRSSSPWNPSKCLTYDYPRCCPQFVSLPDLTCKRPQEGKDFRGAPQSQ